MTIKIEQNIIVRLRRDQSLGKCVKKYTLKFISDYVNNKKHPKNEKREIL